MSEPEAPPPDLEGFVLDKLIQVVGAPSAAATLSEAKRAANVDKIASPVGDLLVLTAGRWRSP